MLKAYKYSALYLIFDVLYLLITNPTALPSLVIRSYYFTHLTHFFILLETQQTVTKSSNSEIDSPSLR